MSVKQIHELSKKAVSAAEIEEALGWEKAKVYKHLKAAENLGLLRREPITRRNNEKWYTPTNSRHSDFLLSPEELLRLHPELVGCQYPDPITGNTVTVGREQRSAPPKRVTSGLKPKWERLPKSSRSGGRA